MDSWGILKPVLLPVSVITVVSTIIVMVVSGTVTQLVLTLLNKHPEGHSS